MLRRDGVETMLTYHIAARRAPTKLEGKLDQSLAVVDFRQTGSLSVTESAGMNHGLQQLKCSAEALLQCETVLSATGSLID
jgi:hypothetical protein